MLESCLSKQVSLRVLFENCKTPEEKYSKIIELGREEPPLDAAHKTPQNLVQGCQSLMYLHSYLKDGKIYFEAASDALISFGLAALLIRVYSGESPEVILKCPPDYLQDLGIPASLTPSRANGLYNIHLRMKQDALKWLIANHISF